MDFSIIQMILSKKKNIGNFFDISVFQNELPGQKFIEDYANATALAAPPKNLDQSGAAVRIHTGQE